MDRPGGRASGRSTGTGGGARPFGTRTGENTTTASGSRNGGRRERESSSDTRTVTGVPTESHRTQTPHTETSTTKSSGGPVPPVTLPGPRRRGPSQHPHGAGREGSFRGQPGSATKGHRRRPPRDPRGRGTRWSGPNLGVVDGRHGPRRVLHPPLPVLRCCRPLRTLARTHSHHRLELRRGNKEVRDL